ncbi:MAG: hypothetical protein ISS33_01295 [Candidatus Omnitrophica bacterium]|nr:hypothetical protein [Candidatus Omnitrophota bacterium]
MNLQDSEDRREFLRVDYDNQLNFKVLKGEKLTGKQDVWSRNVSASGLLFSTSSEASIPALASVVWVELNQKLMNVCQEIENDLVIHNNGVFGRVVRISEGESGKSYDIGVCFLRKKDMTPEEIQTLTAE